MSEPSQPNPADSTSEPVQMAIPKTFYDPSRRDYLVQDMDNNWIRIDAHSLKVRLGKAGISTKAPRGTGYSPADEVAVAIQHQRSIVYAGPLAGYQSNCYQMHGNRVLVTSSPKLITPVQGEWPLLAQVYEQFRDDDYPIQVDIWHSWMQEGAVALYTGKRSPGQAFVMVGPVGSGKSLMQDIITALMGGRDGRPYRYMTGATTFNRDLFGAEHLRISDEVSNTDPRARHRFGAQIKLICAEPNQSCHGKGRDAIVLSPFWRLTICTNPGLQHLMVLPPLESSLREKMQIVLTKARKLPMPTKSPAEKAAFWAALQAEFAHYLWWLLNVYQPPEELRTERWCLKPFTHPYVLGLLEETAPEQKLMSLVEQVIWPQGIGAMEVWNGTAEELANLLFESAFKEEAKKLLNWPLACGSYLSEYAEAFPDRVAQKRSRTQRRWHIAKPGCKLPEQV